MAKFTARHDPAALADRLRAALGRWIDLAENYVGKLPAKGRK